MAGPAKNTKVTVMIFEYSNEWAGFARNILIKEGLDVVEWVKSGTKWMNKWHAAQPELIIVDLLLPIKDGLSVIERIIGLDEETKIIFTHSFTGGIANNFEIRALSLGARSVIQKPYTEKRFLMALKRAGGYEKAK
jgi:DNA-binding response OmpR family regulator